MALVDKIWKWEKRTLMALAFALSINALSIPVTQYINSRELDGGKTAVFTSGYDDSFLPSGIVSGLADFFMYSPITLRQNLEGNQVDWYSNSTKKQVLNVLQNPNYQNIVFIGHGGKSYYEATDGMVTVDDLFSIDLPERQGEFIQHTCGSGNGISLREALYPTGSKGYGFNKDVSILENYGRSLVELVRR